jgi:hypothetical protein
MTASDNLTSPFELDPERLRLGHNHESLLQKPDVKRRPVYQLRRFVNSMPFEWITSACGLSGKAVQVALAIWDLFSLARSQPIVLARKHLEQFRVRRHAAYRALKKLEQAGLISSVRKTGRAPRVTIPDRYLHPTSQSKWED